LRGKSISHFIVTNKIIRSFGKIYLNTCSQNLFQGKQGTIGNSSAENYTTDIVLLCNSSAHVAPYAISTEHYFGLKRGAVSKVYDGCTWILAITRRN